MFAVFRISAVLFLAFCCVKNSCAEILTDAGGRKVRFAGKYDPRPVFLTNPPAPRREFRGVWIATVKNLDIPPCRSTAAFRANIRSMFDKIAAAKFNAVIFQVRPHSDAYYHSAISPVSRCYSGYEGKTPDLNFDPLPFIISEAHKRGLEFHAWLNPYRVTGETTLSKKNYLQTLHRSNFAARNPDKVLSFRQGRNNSLFLDPGNPAVVNHLGEVVRELVVKYNIDAIHIDDYFYPYENIGTLDAATFKRFNPGKLPLGDWRRQNTEKLVVRIRQVIDRENRRLNKKVRFGVSPFGIWANGSQIRGGSPTGGKQTYSDLYADTRKWVKKRYIDYIVPQIYWQFSHEKAAYAGLTQWWCNTTKNSGVKLYIGLAPYRLGSPGWGENELVNQIRFNRARAEISGSVFFSYRHVFGKNPHRGVKKMLNYIR